MPARGNSLLLLASHAPLTMRATKEALRRLRDSLPPDEDLIRLCYTSAGFSRRYGRVPDQAAAGLAQVR